MHNPPPQSYCPLSFSKGLLHWPPPRIPWIFSRLGIQLGIDKESFFFVLFLTGVMIFLCL